MTISTEQTLAQQELNLLFNYGARVYETANQLAQLRATVATWINEMNVQVVFDPSTPPELKDYLLGATLGAVEGALAGAALGLLVGAFLNAPAAGLMMGAAGGGATGATLGVAAVAGGYRVRVKALEGIGGPFLLVETT